MAYDKRLWPLVGGNLNATAWGSVDWIDVNGAWRARVPVAADNFFDAELGLEMVVRPGPRAVEPSVLLIFKEDSVVRRVDVNGTHREDGRPRRQTHVQGEPPPNFLKWLDDSAIPSPAVDSTTVTGEDYYRIFAAAASVIGVDIHGVEWLDPPEEGAS